MNFKRRLRKNEEADFSAVLKAGKEKVGNNGKSILIVPTASLPQSTQIGMGNLLDKGARDFVDFAKLYWGINEIQTLPEGVYRVRGGNRYKLYSGSSLDFGSHIINFDLLTEKEYANLLTKEDISRVCLSETQELVDFENVLKKGSNVDKMLHQAHDELLKANTEEKNKLLDNIKNYVQNNYDWIEKKGIFEALSEKFKTRDCERWPEEYKNLYDIEKVPLERRKSIISEIKQGDLAKEIEFYNFKQYLAENHFLKAKKELNKKGIKLNGDMIIGFSNDEEWANPKAFYRGKSGGWGLPVLNYDTPEAEAVLRKKVNRFARLYDGIRVDAGWKYISQDVIDKKTKKRIFNKQHGEKLLKIIEDEVLKVKGKSFDLSNIMYEFIAGIEYFNMYDGFSLKKSVADRTKIITSYDLNPFWGTSTAFKESNWGSSYILGATNHDSMPLRAEFANLKIKEKQINTLSEILKIPKEKLNSFEGFVQAKFAEPMRSKHNMFFFTEALNLDERYKDNVNCELDYRLKVPKNYQEHYFKSLEKGLGFNPMDALDKAFVAEGLNKTEPELYKKILKYKKILQSPEIKKANKFYAGIAISISLIFAGILIYKKRTGKTGSNVLINQHQDKI